MTMPREEKYIRHAAHYKLLFTITACNSQEFSKLTEYLSLNLMYHCYRLFSMAVETVIFCVSRPTRNKLKIGEYGTSLQEKSISQAKSYVNNEHASFYSLSGTEKFSGSVSISSKRVF